MQAISCFPQTWYYFELSQYLDFFLQTLVIQTYTTNLSKGELRIILLGH